MKNILVLIWNEIKEASVKLFIMCIGTLTLILIVAFVMLYLLIPTLIIEFTHNDWFILLYIPFCILGFILEKYLNKPIKKLLNYEL